MVRVIQYRASGECTLLMYILTNTMQHKGIMVMLSRAQWYNSSSVQLLPVCVYMSLPY